LPVILGVAAGLGMAGLLLWGLRGKVQCPP
jgi:hypothetical protein